MFVKKKIHYSKSIVCIDSFIFNWRYLMDLLWETGNFTILLLISHDMFGKLLQAKIFSSHHGWCGSVD